MSIVSSEVTSPSFAKPRKAASLSLDVEDDSSDSDNNSDRCDLKSQSMRFTFLLPALRPALYNLDALPLAILDENFD